MNTTLLVLMVCGIGATVIGRRGLTQPVVSLFRFDIFDFIIRLFTGKLGQKRPMALLIGRSAKIVGIFYIICGPIMVLLAGLGLFTGDDQYEDIAVYPLLVALFGYVTAWIVNRMDWDKNAGMRQSIEAYIERKKQEA